MYLEYESASLALMSLSLSNNACALERVGEGEIRLIYWAVLLGWVDEMSGINIVRFKSVYTTRDHSPLPISSSNDSPDGT